jgi:hypothetical protein
MPGRGKTGPIAGSIIADFGCSKGSTRMVYLIGKMVHRTAMLAQQSSMLPPCAKFYRLVK